jgi:hypothetical protein
MSKVVTKDQMKAMFEAQFDLNVAYNGDEWKNIQFYKRFSASFDEENAEFLEELTGMWKWHGRVKIDRQAALFEAVDAFHYMLATALAVAAEVDGSKEGCLTQIYEEVDQLFMDGFFRQTGNPYPYGSVDHFLFAYELLKASSSKFFLDLHLQVKKAISESDFSVITFDSIYYMRNWVYQVCEILGISAETFFKAYKMKNDRCHERVIKGVMKGIDVKANESPLFIELDAK